ncbi:hypothetical protein EVAR_61996_1 [Eumeta japonica]|uniref:Uncharacterized protein n=1 Tax=Eumeta variegata TaxID=151549 RepID=A0A4C1YIQ2_EUMVA|nr:hypothetical protein EVAR_61996_1 [Eumeta japonica]
MRVSRLRQKPPPKSVLTFCMNTSNVFVNLWQPSKAGLVTTLQFPFEPESIHGAKAFPPASELPIRDLQNKIHYYEVLMIAAESGRPPPEHSSLSPALLPANSAEPLRRGKASSVVNSNFDAKLEGLKARYARTYACPLSPRKARVLDASCKENLSNKLAKSSHGGTAVLGYSAELHPQRRRSVADNNGCTLRQTLAAAYLLKAEITPRCPWKCI